MKNENIKFDLTIEQAKQICKHFEKNFEELQEYEICELLDKIINNLD
jgi:hypothetical protein